MQRRVTLKIRPTSSSFRHCGECHFPVESIHSVQWCRFQCFKGLLGDGHPHSDGSEEGVRVDGRHVWRDAFLWLLTKNDGASSRKRSPRGARRTEIKSRGLRCVADSTERHQPRPEFRELVAITLSMYPPVGRLDSPALDCDGRRPSFPGAVIFLM